MRRMNPTGNVRSAPGEATQTGKTPNRGRLKRAVAVLPTLAFIVLMAASGVVLWILGRQYQSNWAAGLSAIPFAVALFTLASLLRAGPWFLRALKIVFPPLAATIDALLAERHAQLRIESVLQRLQTYLQLNDLPCWTKDIRPLARDLARQIGGQANVGTTAENDPALLEALLAITDEALADARPTLSDPTPVIELGREMDCVYARQPSANGQPASEGEAWDGPLRKGLCLIGVAVFINKYAYELLPLRDEICLRLARSPQANLQLLAYLELKEDRENTKDPGGKDFITLCELSDQWVDVLVQHSVKREGFCHEISTLRQALEDRHWISHLWQLLQRVIARLQVQLHDINALKRTHPAILQSLRRVFGNLELDTIERFLEARTINAYLLTFSNRQGSLATLINSLVSADCRPQLEALGLTLDAGNGNGPKYLLKQYTPRARIGVVPKGWSFQRFQETFEADLNQLIAHQGDLPCYSARSLNEIEIVVQRFGLRDHYSYPPDTSPLRSRRATLNIRELLADVLDEDDFVAVIAYEHDKTRIVDLLLDGPIAGLVDGANLLSDDERVEIAAADFPLKLEMLHELDMLPANVQDADSVNWGVRKLGRSLSDSHDQAYRATTALAVALCDHVPSLTPQAQPPLPGAAAGNPPPAPAQLHHRRQTIANCYVDTLGAIGALYPRDQE